MERTNKVKYWSYIINTNGSYDLQYRGKTVGSLDLLEKQVKSMVMALNKSNAEI